MSNFYSVPQARGLGFAGKLLDWLIAPARELECTAVHLDTGSTRHPAHRVYFSKGFHLNCHHTALSLE